VHDRADAKAPGEALGQRTCSNIDRKMAAASKRVEAHIAERLRETITGMIANEQNRLLCQRVEYPERPGFLGG
jgi:hypothetical protein